MKERDTKLVQGFRHSVPYINAHQGKTFVIMLNGDSIENNNFQDIINDIGLLHSLGIRLIVVYGASPQIDHILEKNNIKIAYHNSIRVTNSKTLDVVKKIAGKLQLDITARLSMGISNTPLKGAHINVVSGNFIIAQPLGVCNGVDYSHSGRIRRIDKKSIQVHLDNGFIVLIGPVAVSVTGESFNLISEEIATELAIILKVEKIIGFIQEQGIFDFKGEIISELFPNQALKIIKKISLNNSVPSSKVRVLQGAIKACRSGIPRIHIISYKTNGALLQELFSRDGIGTQIVMESSEKICSATINDIRGILELIRPLENQGILVRRSREQLEMEINKFIIIKRDNLIIGCVALYVFLEDSIGEMACFVVHPEYRSSSRGELLLKKLQLEAKKLNLKKIFVLTTQSIHWFQERGFYPVNIDLLPESKKKIYNCQRRSKILMADIN